MRDYFNNEERTRHILTLAMQENIDKFKDSTALTMEEKRYLTNALKNIKLFNVSIYKRFGQSYIRKVERAMYDNDLKLVGKSEKLKDCISHIAQEDLIPCVSEIMYDCFECKRQDWINCPKYCIAVACDIEGTNKKNGCPYA